MGSRTVAQRDPMPWASRYRELGTDPVSTAVYTSEAHLDAEIDRVFARSWLNVARVDDLREAGGFLSLDLARLNTSLLIVRGRDSRVRAFHNVCTHRGSRLVTSGAGQATLFTCRYHGWTFSTDGRLVAVPDEHKFAGLDRSCAGLKPIRCELWNGYVFVCLAGNAAQPLEQTMLEMAPAFEAYPFERLRKRVTYTAEVDANWKVALDIGEEPYHFLFVHRKSIPDSHTGLGQDLAFFPSVRLYHRHRSASIVANSQHRMRPSEQVAFEQCSTMIHGADPTNWAPGLNLDRVANWAFDVHVLFPNCAVLLGVGWSVIHRYWPISAGRTRWETTLYMSEAQNAAELLSQEFSKILTRDLLREDLAMVEINQAGLQSGVLASIRLSDEEILLRHNHRVIHEVLQEAAPAGAEAAGAPPGASASIRSAAGRRVLIHGARIIDGTGRPPLQDHSLLIEDGLIRAIIPHAHQQGIDAQRIDGTGGTLLPGLIDMHAHLLSGGFDSVIDNGAAYDDAIQQRALSQMLYWGVTGCHFSVQPLANASSLRDALAQARLAGPRLYCSGPGVTAPGGWAGSNIREARLELADVAAVAPAIALLAESGVDFVKLFYDDMCCAFHQGMPKLSQPVMQAVVREAHRHGLPVAAHVYELQGHREVLQAGGDILYHSAVTGPIDDDYLRLALANASAYVATLSIYHDTYDPDAVRRWADSVEVRGSVPRRTLKTLERGGPLDQFEKFTRRTAMRERLPIIAANLRRVFEAGIPVAVGPDTGVPGVFPGLSVHREMELMVLAGLAPMAVLRAATGTAAALIGDPAIGTIEKGKRADLVLLAADPLADIRATRAISAVVQNGMLIDRPRLLDTLDLGAAA